MRKVYESIYSSMRKRTGTIAFLCRIMKKHGMDWHTRYNIQACLRNDKKRIKRILTVVFESWPTTITSTGIPQWHVTIPLMAEIKEQLLLLQKFGVLLFRNSCHILIYMYNFSYYIFKNRYFISVLIFTCHFWSMTSIQIFSMLFVHSELNSTIWILGQVWMYKMWKNIGLTGHL